MIDLFLSYSHRDEPLRNELEIHLAMLRRQGLIRVWHDRRIPAGAALDESIDQHLEAADVILLLLSPYFLASDYCYEREAARALERHANRQAVVIPVILEPCDWQNSPFRHLRATPTDGRPVTKFSNYHDAFLEITIDIRAAAELLHKRDAPAQSILPAVSLPLSTPPGPRSSNLRLKRTFSDRDRDTFREEAFAYVSSFFENSLNELSRRNRGVESRFNSDRSEFTVAVYIDGQKKASCRVWSQNRSQFGGDITYSSSDSPGSNSFNEGLSIGDDGYTLGLQPLGMAALGNQPKGLLTPHGAAEYLWEMLVSRLR